MIVIGELVVSVENTSTDILWNGFQKRTTVFHLQSLNQPITPFHLQLLLAPAEPALTILTFKILQINQCPVEMLLDP
jgi:hypothetical protein